MTKSSRDQFEKKEEQAKTAASIFYLPSKLLSVSRECEPEEKKQRKKNKIKKESENRSEKTWPTPIRLFNPLFQSRQTLFMMGVRNRGIELIDQIRYVAYVDQLNEYEIRSSKK